MVLAKRQIEVDAVMTQIARTESLEESQLKVVPLAGAHGLDDLLLPGVDDGFQSTVDHVGIHAAVAMLPDSARENDHPINLTPKQAAQSLNPSARARLDELLKWKATFESQFQTALAEIVAPDEVHAVLSPISPRVAASGEEGGGISHGMQQTEFQPPPPSPPEQPHNYNTHRIKHGGHGAQNSTVLTRQGKAGTKEDFSGVNRHTDAHDDSDDTKSSFFLTELGIELPSPVAAVLSQPSLEPHDSPSLLQFQQQPQQQKSKRQDPWQQPQPQPQLPQLLQQLPEQQQLVLWRTSSEDDSSSADRCAPNSSVVAKTNAQPDPGERPTKKRTHKERVALIKAREKTRDKEYTAIRLGHTAKRNGYDTQRRAKIKLVETNASKQEVIEAVEAVAKEQEFHRAEGVRMAGRFFRFASDRAARLKEQVLVQEREQRVAEEQAAWIIQRAWHRYARSRDVRADESRCQLWFSVRFCSALAGVVLFHRHPFDCASAASQVPQQHSRERTYKFLKVILS
jgi:hypothetical protein